MSIYDLKCILLNHKAVPFFFEVEISNDRMVHELLDEVTNDKNQLKILYNPYEWDCEINSFYEQD